MWNPLVQLVFIIRINLESKSLDFNLTFHERAMRLSSAYVEFESLEITFIV